MKYKVEKSLSNFDFWSGAADRVKSLTRDELEQLDDILPGYFGAADGEQPTETEINDMFWFDFPTICHALGYACVDDEPIRDAEDFEESFRIDLLLDALIDNAVDDTAVRELTDEQLKELDKKCLAEGDVYTLNIDEDTCDVEGYYAESYAKELGFLPED